MLVEIHDADWFVGQLVARERGLRYFQVTFVKRRKGLPPARYLVDDPANPRSLVMQSGRQFAVIGEGEALQCACRDLYHGRYDPAGPEHQEHIRAGQLASGHRSLWIRGYGRGTYHTLVQAGFHVPAHEYIRRGMWIYYLEGAPRYGHLVNHSCRVVHGMELFERMRLGIHYDPTGQYIRDCLENGPSFVCEIDGEPVCWSCTHLNGQPGMIYTPPEHRRHGYARSLAAFQLDYMLERDGFTHVYVLEFNWASRSLMESLGFDCTRDVVVTYSPQWDRLRQPSFSCSPSPTPGNRSWRALRARR